MNTSRRGKIARLPQDIREQLNQRLVDAEPGGRLVDWLNDLPAVRQILAKEFDGHAINEQNLTNWRQGGHQEWRKLRQVREFCMHAVKVPEAIPTLEQLTTLTVANYLVRIRGRMDHKSPKAWREFRTYCHDVVKFRRVEIQAGRLEFDLDRLEFNREKLAETKKTIAGRVVEVVRAALAIRGVKAEAKGKDAEHSTLNIQRSTSKGNVHPPAVGGLQTGGNECGDGPSPFRGGAQTGSVDCPPSPQSSPPGRGGNLARFSVHGSTTTPPVARKSQAVGNEDEDEDVQAAIKVNQGEINKKKFVPDGPTGKVRAAWADGAAENRFEVCGNLSSLPGLENMCLGAFPRLHRGPLSGAAPPLIPALPSLGCFLATGKRLN
jgi:hypothetical protein